MELKNKVITLDRRMDRIPFFDERSRKHPLLTATAKKKKTPKSKTYRCPAPLPLDQGNEGKCVGTSIVGEMIAWPAEVKGLDETYAREEIYWPAQKLDPWEGGSYPNASVFYEGTSILAGLKAAILAGAADGYKWGFGIVDAVLGWGYKGPPIFGTFWTQGMLTPDENGFIWPTGDIIGGHAYFGCKIKITSYDKANPHDWTKWKGYGQIMNSWGSAWGDNGRAKLTFESLDWLLRNQGEVAWLVKRHSKIGREVE